MLETNRQKFLAFVLQKYVPLLQQRHDEVGRLLQNIKSSRTMAPYLFDISTLEKIMEWLESSIDYKRGLLRSRIENETSPSDMEDIVSYLEFYDELLKTLAYILHQISLSSQDTFPELNAIMYDFLARFGIENQFVFTIGSQFSVYSPWGAVSHLKGIIGPELAEKFKTAPYFVSIPLMDAHNWHKLPAIVHEAAHIVDDCKGFSHSILEPMVDIRSDAQYASLTRSWTSEIVADVLAVRYLGPVYLQLFLDSPDFWLHESLSTTHPNFKERIKVAFDELNDMGFSDESVKAEIDAVLPLLSPVALDSDFVTRVVQTIRSKTGGYELSISRLEHIRGETERDISKGLTVFTEPNMLLNIVYNKLDDHNVAATFKKSLIAQHMNSLAQRPDNDRIKELAIPDLVLKIHLIQLWKEGVKRSDTSPNERGIALENYLRVLLNAIPGVRIVEVRKRTATAEIDLVGEIHDGVLRHFAPYFIVESKNMSVPVSAAVVRNFIGVIESYGQKIKLAIMVSTSGFSKEARSERLRLSSRPYSILFFEGTELEQFQTESENVEEFMAKKVRESVFV